MQSSLLLLPTAFMIILFLVFSFYCTLNTHYRIVLYRIVNLAIYTAVLYVFMSFASVRVVLCVTIGTH